MNPCRIVYPNLLNFTFTATTQIILLAAGYLSRSSPSELRNLQHSSLYLTTVSNHLAASSPPSRFLGIVVGMSLSKLVDSSDKAMRFELEDTESEQATWYMRLCEADDKIGSIRDLIKLNQNEEKAQPLRLNKHPKIKHNAAKKRPTEDRSKVISIEELSEQSDDSDLIIYEKPDTDASDSEDDPTLINRTKPSPPV